MEFLISAIDVNTCVDIIHIAEVFNMSQLEEKAYKYLLDRWEMCLELKLLICSLSGAARLDIRCRCLLCSPA